MTSILKLAHILFALHLLQLSDSENIFLPDNPGISLDTQRLHSLQQSSVVGTYVEYPEGAGENQTQQTTCWSWVRDANLRDRG